MDGSSECDSQGDPTAPPRLGTCLEWGPAEGESLWYGSALRKPGGSHLAPNKSQEVFVHNVGAVMHALLDYLLDGNWMLVDNWPVAGLNFFDPMWGVAGTTFVMMWNRVPFLNLEKIKFGTDSTSWQKARYSTMQLLRDTEICATLGCLASPTQRHEVLNFAVTSSLVASLEDGEKQMLLWMATS